MKFIHKKDIKSDLKSKNCLKKLAGFYRTIFCIWKLNYSCICSSRLELSVCRIFMWIILLDWELILSNWSWSEAVTSKLQKSKIQKKKIDLRKIETKQVTIGQPAVLVIWIENFDSKWSRIKPRTTTNDHFSFAQFVLGQSERLSLKSRTIKVERFEYLGQVLSSQLEPWQDSQLLIASDLRAHVVLMISPRVIIRNWQLTIGHENCMNFELKINQLVVILHEFAGTNI